MKSRRPGTNPLLEVDPEFTPPPTELPLDDDSPEVAKKLNEVIKGLERIWSTKQQGEAQIAQLNRIERNLGTVAGYSTEHQALLHDMVIPMVKDCQGSVNKLSAEMPALMVQVETTARFAASTDGQMRSLQVKLEVWVSKVEELSAQTSNELARANKRIDELEVEVDRLKRDARDRKVVTRALTTKEKAAKYGGQAGLTAIVSAIVAAIAKLIS